MNIAANATSSALADLNLRVALKRMADDAQRRCDGPISAILDVAICTLDKRIAEAENALPGTQAARISTQLVRHNVRVSGQRTSIKLEAEFWQALERLSSRGGITVDTLCTRVASLYDGGNLTSAIRVFVLRTMLEAEA